MTHDTMERAQALVDAGVDVIVVDTAHGHSVRVLKTVEKLKKLSRGKIIAGNVARQQERAWRRGPMQ